MQKQAPFLLIYAESNEKKGSGQEVFSSCDFQRKYVCVCGSVHERDRGADAC